MPKTLRPPPLADAIAGHIERMILEGVLRPGERLASERDLAEKLDVSRPSLREALGQLEKRGLLVSGRGGTTVAQFLAPLAAPLAELFRDKARVTADYFEYRCFIEAQTARLAAMRATELDHKTIRAIVQRMQAAHSLEDPYREAEADVDLHLALYEAAHNVVLLHVMRVFAELLRDGIFYNRDQLYRRHGTRATLLEQHLAIADAVLNGKVDLATRVADEHIRFTFDTVEEIRRDKERLEVSLRRLDRSDLVAAPDSMARHSDG
jgi:GntR family transcriptional regulator, transcriptional repressor for pyruvate dehydrogenase complex